MKTATRALLAICWLSATIICLTDACRGGTKKVKVASLSNRDTRVIQALVDSHINYTNRRLADFLYDKVSKNNPDNHVLVMVYNAVAGWKNHAISHCPRSSMLYFRQKKNVVVALGSRKGSKTFSHDSAMRTLRERERRIKFENDIVSSEEWREDLKPVIDCSSVFLVAAIRDKNSGLFIRSTEGSVAVDTGYQYDRRLRSTNLDPESKNAQDIRRPLARQFRIIFG